MKIAHDKLLDIWQECISFDVSVKMALEYRR